MPNFDREAFLALDPADAETILNIKAFQYDIVCNGTELSSGAIRNHRPDVMEKGLRHRAGNGVEVLEEKFGGMLNALKLGAPPHGGIAPGIDRIVMLLCGEQNLREVVLFPMNQRAEDLMMGAPAEATPSSCANSTSDSTFPRKGPDIHGNAIPRRGSHSRSGQASAAPRDGRPDFRARPRCIVVAQ